jgi:hypothetical protein
VARPFEILTPLTMKISVFLDVTNVSEEPEAPTKMEPVGSTRLHAVIFQKTVIFTVRGDFKGERIGQQTESLTLMIIFR